MKKHRKLASVGDLLEIPDDEGVGTLAVTLFASQYYKNVILLGVIGVKPSTDEIRVSPLSLLSMIYTSAQPLKDGRWNIVGKISDIQNVSEYSLRTISGRLWREDDQGREVTARDREILPEMDCAGMTLVESYFAYLRTGSNEAKYFVRTKTKFARFLREFDQLADFWSTSDPG